MNVMVRVLLAIAAFVVVFVVSLSVGEVDNVLAKILGLNGMEFNDIDLIILKEIRLPRIVMAIGVGGLLSMSGLIMQGLFRNPLVEPYTMGLSGGAVLGVAIAFVLGVSEMFGSIGVTLMALLGSLMTMILVLFLRRAMQFDINKMLLSGVMISFATSSVTMLLMSLTSRDNISQIVSWNMGSLDVADSERSYCVVAVLIVMMIVMPIFGRVLNVLSVSESMARHVGVRTGLAVPMLFVVATIMAAVSVSLAGVIAFVGMIVPHIVKSLYGHDHRLTLPMSALCGAIFMMLCDVVARVIIYPQEIPVGVMCGIVGGVMFIYLIMQKERRC